MLVAVGPLSEHIHFPGNALTFVGHSICLLSWVRAIVRVQLARSSWIGVDLSCRNTVTGRRKKTLPKSVAWVAADYIAPKIAKALLSIRPAEARIVRREAALLAYLKEGQRYQQAGLGTPAAFALETLQMSPSTMKERVALDRTLRECPLAEEAFLEGRLTVCKINVLGPALRAAPEKATEWIERARKKSVRALRRLVKEEVSEAPERAAETMISFQAPPSVHLAFDAVLELGRKQIGHNVPRCEVIEALLFETGFSGAGEVPEEEDSRPVPKRAEVVLHGSPKPPSEAMARVVKTLEELDEHLKQIDTIAASDSPSSTFEAIDQLDRLLPLERSLRIFQARLLRDLRATRAVYVLGFRSVSDFVENHLGVSERTARNMVADAELFEDVPSLTEAYVRRDISLGKAHRVRWLTNGRDVDAHCRRAAEVTHRQFDREYRFQTHLRQCFPILASRFRGPLPQTGLDAALMHDLRKEGLTGEDVEIELIMRDIEPIKEGCSLDPAENPVVMCRLEALLDLLVAAHWADPPEVEERLVPRDRQTFGLDRTPVYIRIRVPRGVAADWRAAIKATQEQLGLFTPEWKAAVVLFAHVYEEWSRVDPESEPTQKKILKRDRFQCQAPACPKRSNLEAHHLKRRSKGGSNKVSNLLTLCHGDHQHVVHAGYAKVSGEAPQALRWELGCRPSKEPLLKRLGERIVGGSRAPATR